MKWAKTVEKLTNQLLRNSKWAKTVEKPTNQLLRNSKRSNRTVRLMFEKESRKNCFC